MTRLPPPDPRSRALPGGVDLWWHVGQVPAGRGHGRALLGHALAAHPHYRPHHSHDPRDLNRDPGTLRLAPDPLGRPSPAPGQGLPPLVLAAAHSGAVTVAALSPSGPPHPTAIGIDVEHLPAFPSAALLSLALRPAERAALSERPAPDRLAAFLTVWTAKEAVAKALGWPLLRALADVEIALHPRPAVVRLGTDLSPRGWRLVPLRLPGVPHTVTLALRHRHPAPERMNPWT